MELHSVLHWFLNFKIIYLINFLNFMMKTYFAHHFVLQRQKTSTNI